MINAHIGGIHYALGYNSFKDWLTKTQQKQFLTLIIFQKYQFHKLKTNATKYAIKKKKKTSEFGLSWDLPVYTIITFGQKHMKSSFSQIKIKQ